MTFYWVRVSQVAHPFEHGMQRKAEPEGRLKPKHLPASGVQGEQPDTRGHQRGQSFPAGNRSLAWKRPRNKQARLRSTCTLFQGHPEISSGRVSTGLRGLGIHRVIRRGIPTHVQGAMELIFYLKGKWTVISELSPTQGTKVYSTLHSGHATFGPPVTHHLASVCLSFLHPGHTSPPSSTLMGHCMLSL